MDENGPLDLSEEPDDGYVEAVEIEEETRTTVVTRRTIRIRTHRVQAGDLDGLVAALRDKGIDDDDIDDLKDALKQDEHDEDRDERGVGTRTRRWLGGMASKFVTGVVIETVTRLVLIFLGLPPG